MGLTDPYRESYAQPKIAKPLIFLNGWQGNLQFWNLNLPDS
jgi:hypothetical protein